MWLSQPLRERPDALFVDIDPFFTTACQLVHWRRTIAPATYPGRQFAEAVG